MCDSLEARTLSARVLAIACLLWGASVSLVCASAQPPHPAAAGDSLEDVVLGGARQKILVLGDDPAKPVLLWLHGDPGESAVLLSHHSSGELRRHATIVHWDQRGSGLSYDASLDPRQVSEQAIEADAVEPAWRLAARFGKKRIYLLGHSFGSVIGLRLAAAHPELVCAYIGVGQVIHPARSEKLTFAWLEQTLRRAGDDEGLRRLRQGGPAVADLVRRYGGRLHTKVDYDGIIRSSPHCFDGYLERKNAARSFCQRASAANRTKGEDNFFREAAAVRLPLYFFEGRYDRVPARAAELVVEYSRKVRAPHAEIVWFESSAHLPNLEESERFQAVLRDRVFAATRGSDQRH